MQNSQTPSSSRKKFLLWSAVILSSATVLKFVTGNKKEKGETVKMLSEDGTLVEIDKDLLVSTGKKISNTELQNWIKK